MATTFAYEKYKTCENESSFKLNYFFDAITKNYAKFLIIRSRFEAAVPRTTTVVHTYIRTYIYGCRLDSRNRLPLGALDSASVKIAIIISAWDTYQIVINLQFCRACYAKFKNFKISELYDYNTKRNVT